MPQVHFYVPERLASRIRDRANAAGLSVSRYVAEVVKTELASDWPTGFFDEVAGGWQGLPLERQPQGTPDSRDTLET
jgi:hypothetical protein